MGDRVFRELRLRDWRQYADVEIGFHDRLTVLTGANGSGKTTILNVLNRHFNWTTYFVRSPRLMSSENAGVRWRLTPAIWGQRDDAIDVGSLEYSDGTEASVVVPAAGEGQQQYTLELRNQAPVDGLFIPSHRPPFFYQQVDQIPTRVSARAEMYEQYVNDNRARFSYGHQVQSPSMRLKQSLLSLAVFGYPSQVNAGDDEAVRTFEGFVEALTKVLPPKLGFESLRVRAPEVILQTRTGDIALDAMSGGIGALFDLAWQIYLYSAAHDSFVVLIDEPENHLHPEMQRNLMPSLVAAFPHVQFVVATHNPFIVSSEPESHVYVLDFGSDERVRSQLLDRVNRAGTSNEILRDVLGLEMTMPRWAEQKLDEIAHEFTGEPLSRERVAALRAALGDIGLEYALPEALDRVLGADD